MKEKHSAFLYGVIFLVMMGLLGNIQLQRMMDEDYPELVLPDGFQSEMLFHPTKADSSSWVSLALDGEDGLFAADQNGAIYHIHPPPIGGHPDDTRVKVLDIEIGHAQGLLWAFNSLYVVVNREEHLDGHPSGLYRIIDSDRDSELDSIEQLIELEGWGEHGPHGIILGPDRSSLYLVAGNHTEVPVVDHYVVPPVWKTDQLLPTLLDPRGHAADRQPPGGWIIRMDSLGNQRELVSVGFRNAYDLAFNRDGELFTFDSDMEWDLGTPWYRPIRILHVTQGSEFGWRTGSDKWSDDYPDNLPSVVDIGQGSPTGILATENAKFPYKYRQGLLAFDWSFGTIYHISLKARGSTYTGEVEEFLSGTPLPLTDGVIGHDGALYFLTGGRKLNSYLFRVFYNDAVDLEEKVDTKPSPQRQLRHSLEALQSPQSTMADVELAWNNLDHPDRFIRYAARIVVEHQPSHLWQSKALQEQNPVRRIHAIIALARHADPSVKDDALQSLLSIEPSDLSSDQEIDFLRAVGLVCIRLGPPQGDLRLQLIDRLQRFYPSTDERLNREYGQLLATLQAPHLVEQMMDQLTAMSGQPILDTYLIDEDVSLRSEQYGEAINQMRSNPPSLEEIELVMNLRILKDGWTPELRENYFIWFHEAMRRSGGESYVGFLEDIRSDAAEQLTGQERDALVGLIDSSPEMLLSDLPQPQGPPRAWNLQQLHQVLDEQLSMPRDFAHGQIMYSAALCDACHRIALDGGNIGPDLTAIASRFSRNEILSAIDSPSDEISDQYEATVLTMDDGTKVVGRILGQENGQILINQNPYDPSQEIKVDTSRVLHQEASPVSTMPARLFDRLNEQEVADLMAFLLSGADLEHKCYTGRDGCNTDDG